MSDPFSLNVFMPSGNTDGIRIVSNVEWNGEAIWFPKQELGSLRKLRRNDMSGGHRQALEPARMQIDDSRGARYLERTGTYVLWNRDEAFFPPLYIGESDDVGTRLYNHSLPSAKKLHWEECTDIAAFVSKDDALDKAHVLYLQARLFELAELGQRCDLRYGQKPGWPRISKGEAANAELYLSHVLQCFPLFGLTAFQIPSRPADGGRMLTLRFDALNLTAHAVLCPEGFLVLENSQASLDVVRSFRENLPTYYEERERLFERGILVRRGNSYRFARDHSFSTPSRATAVITGSGKPAYDSWTCQEAGKERTLREITSWEH